DWDVPFGIGGGRRLLLVWLDTAKGVGEPVVMHDVFQTYCRVRADARPVGLLAVDLERWAMDASLQVKAGTDPRVVVWEDLLGERNPFWKHLIGGAFVTIAMTGLDQDLMQKNLSMKTIGEAQKNMLTFTGIFVVINLFFLAVGALLYIYVAEKGIDISALPTADYLYPEI